MSRLDPVFSACRAESRAALIGYLPAGYPTVEGSKDVLRTMVASGCDLVEVGLPFSDPVMDGVTIQRAAEQALRGGFRVRDLFGVVESVAAAGGRAVVMTYWNPVLAYGVDRFARDLAAAGGLGVITPDLVPDEGASWIEATDAHDLDRIFLVAPSSTEERISLTARSSRGFLYATSVMGVTGARDVVSSAAPALVKRVREHTDMPIGVGLGVRNGAQAAELAAFADGVIVGSAFVSAVQDGTVEALTVDLASGVRQAAASV
ncbi:tryptophan synthase subunit alpha [Saccharothrix sp. S26]|uniref:tryptophan synthase subunit alpha n=1 Tax=Saccharothrix sp. S26 TaxID=2907215 RepID=UPI001F3A5CE0|nr:tryptophan synthase subunit alpha [Saccharothrix sp. S26]MCE6993857.1 tryptophan synthase subunit alpha [Saccharothrix sp. S26]